ncbi:hypothetical protein B4900_10990 [Yersinia rohdei]|nr:hypothetical protein B4900_10990 [Yersinia rohdei]
MADESTDLAVIDIKPEQAPVLYVPNGLEDYLNHIRELAKEVPDVTTKKGRERIGSLARSVGVSKKAIENPGRAYLKQLKELVKPAEEELKRFVDACDDISKSILKPRVEWDAEQERIEAEEAYAAMWQESHEMDASITAERLIKKESDHEMALLMNDAFDRDAKAKADEVERLRKAHEEFIAQQAAEKVKREAEEKAKRDIEAAEQRERDAKLAQERAEQKAEQDKKDAAAKAEREKQEAIAAEQRKAQETAYRIQREAKQKEDARLAEEKRVADEAASKAADKAHQAEVNNAAIAVLTKAGIDAECAKACIIAIVKNQVAQSFLNQQPPIQMNY